MPSKKNNLKKSIQPNKGDVNKKEDVNQSQNFIDEKSDLGKKGEQHPRGYK